MRNQLSLDDVTGAPGDFDFLTGDWLIDNRRLKTWGANCEDWQLSRARLKGFTLLGGAVSVDEIVFADLGFSGCSFRSLNNSTKLWAIYWADSRTGLVYPPVHGGFCGLHGVFEGNDHDAGRPVKVRFEWERTAEAPVWRQSFSYDRGETWETNWVMEFRRP